MIRVRASQIFTHSLEDAVAAKKTLDSGAPFVDVVEKYSTCPSKKNAGDLGWMPDDSLQSLLGSEVKEEDRGKIIGPIHSQYGYHILSISDIEVEEVTGSITGETKMNELNAQFPEVHSLLFSKFHIGLPVDGYSPEETVTSVCKSHSKSDAEVLNFLNSEMADKQGPVIAPAELRDKLKSGSANLVLLDIREKWERDIACIDEAILITSENNESVLSSLQDNQEIVLIDWKQDRGPSFQKWLMQRGLSNIKCLQGGIDAWAESIDTQMARYDIDEDDEYRYEDILEEDTES
jgi:rhodanese-related sulfurtransferase